MKIKTIVDYDTTEFDNRVNKHIKDGCILEHRGLLPPDRYSVSAHYAQLVLPDPPAEPEPFDPALALHQVQTFCHAQPRCDDCPVEGWCQQLRDGGDPTDWDLSEEVPF